MPYSPTVKEAMPQMEKRVLTTSAPDPFPPRFSMAWLVGLAMLFWLLCVLDYMAVFEDAFISFRYAENFARGEGLVFNLGERIWGYSNFLWTLLLGLWIKLGGDVVIASKVLGFAASLAVLCMAMWTLRGFGTHLAPALLAPALLAASPHWRLATQNGMETMLFTALVFAGLVLLVVCLERRLVWPWYAPFFIACAMTRPEGPVFALLAAFFEGLGFLLGRDRRCLRRGLVGVGVFAVGFCTYTFGMYLYYGQPLPNPYYVKVAHDTASLWRGVLYVTTFFNDIRWPFLLWPLLFLPFWTKGRRLSIVMAGGLALHVAFVIYVGGDFEVYFYRFLVPVIPPLAILTAGGLQGARNLLERSSPRLASFFSAAAFTGLLLVAFALTRSPVTPFFDPGATRTPLLLARLQQMDPGKLPARFREWFSPATFDIHPMGAVGMALAGRIAPGTTLATCQCGQIPYYLPKSSFIDLCGLMVPRVHPPLSSSGYLLERGVDIFIEYQKPEPPLAHPKTLFPWLLAEEGFGKNYVLSHVFEHSARIATRGLESRVNMLLFKRRVHDPGGLDPDPEHIPQAIERLRREGRSTELLTVVDGPARGIFVREYGKGDYRPLAPWMAAR